MLFPVLTGLATGCSSSSAGEPVPGARTMDVDGRTVAYLETGTGPSVVFEAGLGDGYAAWQTVLSSVSQRATVFAYDRAGNGGSGAVQGPRDGAHIVAELERNLASAHVPPPYVLVGHSLGGPLMLTYARLHPDDVRGIVLVDGRPAGYTDRCIAEVGRDACVPTAAELAQSSATARAEYDALEDTMRELLATPPLPKVPAIVLTHGKSSDSSALEALWQVVQKDMAVELSATQRVIPTAGHYIQLDAPSAVVDAITELLPR